MKETIADLNRIIKDYTTAFGKFSEDELQQKPNPAKWSRKEVIGHLIDSGHNNLRRFIIGQYEASPPKIVYDQNFWVSANNYQGMNGQDVIALWRLVNLQIVNILSNMSTENYTKQCDTNKQGVTLHTLDWLASDYVKHLKHHINQVIPNSFNVVYP